MHGMLGIILAATLASTGPYLGQTPPGDTPVPFAVADIAPDHSVPVFAPDRVEVYWAQAAERDAPRHIFRSFLSANGWSPPTAMPFTSNWDGDCPVFSPDGDRLYFNSTRPLTAAGGERRERLWVTEREASGWSPARALPPEINAGHLHWRCSVDRDGNVYFGADRTGGQGRDDIHVSRRVGDRHLPASSLAPPINTPCHESTPYVAPDGSYLLFARSCYGADKPDVPLGLLASFRLPDGSWSEPAPVPLAGVAADDAVCPTITPDGRFLFFLVLDRHQRTVYWVDADVVRRLAPDGRRPAEHEGP